MDYWRDAVRIVKAGRDNNPAVRRCIRFDDAEIMWDSDARALVIVNPDGTIETMFRPDGDGNAYYESECARTN
jgi:hypothetical protein